MEAMTVHFNSREFRRGFATGFSAPSLMMRPSGRSSNIRSTSTLKEIWLEVGDALREAENTERGTSGKTTRAKAASTG
jgi:hypothetical protein